MNDPLGGESNSEQRPDDPRHLHLWQIQAVRDIAVLAGLVLLVLCGYWLRSVTVPLLIALALAYLFEPIVVRLTRRFNVGRPAVVGSLVGVLAIFFAVSLLGVALTLVQTVDLLRRLPETVGEAIRFIDRNVPDSIDEPIFDGLENLIGAEPAAAPPTDATEQVEPDETEPTDQPVEPPPGETEQETEPPGEVSAQAEPETAGESARASQIADRIRLWVQSNLGAIFQATVQTTGDALSLIGRFVGSTIYIAFTLFLIPFYFFAFSTGWPKLRRTIVEIFPVEHSETVYSMLHKMDLAVSGFVRGRIVVCSIMAVLLAAGWWMCGVPYWLLLGILTGIFSIVPYLGGVGLPIAIGLLWFAQSEAGGGEGMAWWGIILWPTVVFAVVQIIETYILTPIIAGKATNLGPVSILVAVLAGGVVGGVYGMILAIPVAACSKIIIMDVVLPRVKKYGRGEASDLLPISDD